MNPAPPAGPQVCGAPSGGGGALRGATIKCEGGGGGFAGPPGVFRNPPCTTAGRFGAWCVDVHVHELKIFSSFRRQNVNF